MKTIMIDVDGVLADFTTAFTSLLNSIDESVRVHGGDTQDTWNFDVAPLVNREAWKRVTGSTSWWAELNPMPQATPESMRRLQNWADDHDYQIVFCTAREGKAVTVQTSHWLWMKLRAVPTGLVVVGSPVNKYDVARGLNVRFAIDDNPKLLGMLPHIPKIKTYAPEYPYNRGLAGVEYVTGFGDFVERITG